MVPIDAIRVEQHDMLSFAGTPARPVWLAAHYYKKCSALQPAHAQEK